MLTHLEMLYVFTLKKLIFHNKTILLSISMIAAMTKKIAVLLEGKYLLESNLTYIL